LVLSSCPGRLNKTTRRSHWMCCTPRLSPPLLPLRAFWRSGRFSRLGRCMLRHCMGEYRSKDENRRPVDTVYLDTDSIRRTTSRSKASSEGLGYLVKHGEKVSGATVKRWPSLLMTISLMCHKPKQRRLGYL